jgi:hypothetical protein
MLKLIVIFPYLFISFAIIAQTSLLPVKNNYTIIDSICLQRKVKIDKKLQSLTFPVLVNMERGEIEVLLCRQEGKTHESIFTTDITPVELHTLLLCIGMQPASECPLYLDQEGFLTFLKQDVVNADKEAIIRITFTDASGRSCKIRAENLLISRETGLPLRNKTWFFSGIKSDKKGIYNGYWISLSGTLFNSFDIMTLSCPEAWQNNLLWMNEAYHLKVGQQVFLTIERKKKNT